MNVTTLRCNILSRGPVSSFLKQKIFRYSPQLLILKIILSFVNNKRKERKVLCSKTLIISNSPRRRTLLLVILNLKNSHRPLKDKHLPKQMCSTSRSSEHSEITSKPILKQPMAVKDSTGMDKNFDLASSTSSTSNSEYKPKTT